MRFVTSVAAVAGVSLLLALPVGAEDPHPAKPGSAKPGPLAPGQSAGVRAAQQPHTGLALIGAGAAIVVVVIVAAGSGGRNSGQANSQLAPATTS